MKAENKATDYFKITIQSYLEQRAQIDELFAPIYAKPNKNIDDCILWIAIHNTQSSMFFSGLEYWNENNTSVSARWSKYAFISFLK